MTRDPNLKLFECTDHDSHYPVGVASIVIAKNKAEARLLLDAALVEYGLKAGVRFVSSEPYTLSEISLDKPSAHVLRDGNY